MAFCMTARRPPKTFSWASAVAARAGRGVPALPRQNQSEPEQKQNFLPPGQSMVAFAQFLGLRLHLRGAGG